MTTISALYKSPHCQDQEDCEIFYIKHDAYDQVSFSSLCGFAHWKSKQSFSKSEVEFTQCSLGSNFSKQMLAEQRPFVCVPSFPEQLSSDQCSLNLSVEHVLASHLSGECFSF